MSGKRELISDIYGHVKVDGIEKKAVDQIVTMVFTKISERTKKGERVTVKGFGSFLVKHRNAKKGRNPQTGEDMILPARDVLTLKVT